MNAPDLALLELIDVPGLGWDGQATGAPVKSHTQEGRDSLSAHALRAFDVNPEVGTRILDVGEEPPDAIRSLVHARDPWHLQLDVLGAASEVTIDVPLIDCRNRPLDGLHVRLRHGPQYRAGESQRSHPSTDFHPNALALPVIEEPA